VEPSYTPQPGAGVDQIDTPALLLDHDKLVGNIRRMAEFFSTRPARLRPHAKTHKCVEIARLQMEHGAAGITCAKLGEAEVMAAGGIPDIRVANQVVGPLKIARLVGLAGRCTLTIAVDDAENVRQISAAAAAAGVTVRCLVEVDIGMGRCGVDPGQPALDLARLVDGSPGLTFAGLQAYEGHLQNVTPYDQRRQRARADMQLALDTRELIEEAGLPVAVISGCGTGTHAITGVLKGVDEVQAGSYATMDGQYRKVGAPFENALTLLSTVVSRPRPETAIIDAGLKTVSPEFGEPTVLVGGATYTEFSEEHGTLQLVGAARELQAGDRIELIPAHGCTTINLHDRLYVMSDGTLQEIWAVAARGRSQ
jgi:D-serine deaminase-like pyridoxal phosphate-dependent protein